MEFYLKKLLLEVKKLKTFFYTPEKIIKAVNGIDLQIYEKEIFALVGQTGAGKSITALSIMKLVPPPGVIVDGEIFFEGVNLLEKDEEYMRKIRGNKIAMIFQDPLKALNPVIKIGKQIAEGLVLHKKFNEFYALKEAEKILISLGIRNVEEVLQKYPHQISGGMRQRVQIASALICKPSILIADEPTSSVDPPIQFQVLNTLKKACITYNTSMMLITHNLAAAYFLSNRIAVIHEGEIVEENVTDRFFKNPLHPYSKCLVNAAERLGNKNLNLNTLGKLKLKGSGCKFYHICPYKKNICKTEKPPLKTLDRFHKVKCFHY